MADCLVGQIGCLEAVSSEQQQTRMPAFFVCFWHPRPSELELVYKACHQNGHYEKQKVVRIKNNQPNCMGHE
ncbi:hypothetical protein SLA2020_526850 [Shorea laevis]